jgi:hypothetical protein
MKEFPKMWSFDEFNVHSKSKSGEHNVQEKLYSISNCNKSQKGIRFVTFKCQVPLH